VKRILDLVAMSVGGWLGWMIGAGVSIFTAYVVSVVGAGVALYATRRIMRGLLP